MKLLMKSCIPSAAGMKGLIVKKNLMVTSSFTRVFSKVIINQLNSLFKEISKKTIHGIKFCWKKAKIHQLV